MFDGQTVLVTGANGGLGTEFVRQALDLGARRVYATTRRPKDWNDGRVVPLIVDVTDEPSVSRAAETASDTTVVVNNAGIASLPDNLFELPMAQIRATFDVNVFGAITVARAFAPVLKSNGGGVLVNVLSVLSWIAGDPQSHGGHQAYAASKAALWSATNAMRLGLAPQGTRVVGLHLGYTRSGMTARIDAPKNDPADIVRIAYERLGAGDLEITADALSARVKSLLSAPIEQMYPQISAI